MRRFAAKTVSVFRIAYVAVAVALGSALTAISVGSLWQGIQVATTIVGEPTTQFDPTTGTTVIVNPYVLDGPDPLSFYNYGRAPVMAATFLLIGFMTLKRRWEALSFTCWFLAAPVIVEILSGIFYYGWGSAFSLLSISALWAYVPFVGIVIAAVARSCRSGGESRVTPSVAADDLSIYRRMPLDAVFAVVAVASYLWRVTDVALSPEATRAIDHFLGAPNEYAPNAALVAGSVVGLGAAAALLAGVLMPRRDTSDSGCSTGLYARPDVCGIARNSRRRL